MNEIQVVNDGEASVALPPRPTPPRPEDCCGSGCVNCIYAIYDEALLRWQREVEIRRNDVSGPTVRASATTS